MKVLAADHSDISQEVEIEFGDGQKIIFKVDPVSLGRGAEAL
ncbi:MAG: hypothetical protein U5L96_18005 [Owenweeksia sp.]|nr:hypothetical protein [Owenweeksia sp.]